MRSNNSGSCLNRRKRRLESSINVVPYIDVMLVLLIIFMVTTPLLKQGVKVDLPHAQAKSMSTKNLQPIIVTVDKFGSYSLNLGSLTNLTGIKLQNAVTQLLTKNSKREVLVRGDKDARYGQVVKAMVLLQASGVVKVGLMTEEVKIN